MNKYISTPLTKDKVKELKAGDFVYLSGEIYTARDAAHARLIELVDNNKPLPFDIENATIFYVGPTPARENQVIGSCGPTTSYRMDEYTPKLLDIGLTGMIGKGKRSQIVIDSMVQNEAVYFSGVGGAAALTAESVVESTLICYEDLGAEAIRKLKVVDMPLIVATDFLGNSIFERNKNE